MSKYRLGAVILSTALIAGGLYFYEPPTKPPPVKPDKVKEIEQARGAGVIDIEQIELHHPDYETLNELRGRQIRLQLELTAVMKPVTVPKPPEIDEKPFDDSAREKLMQDFMAQMSELKAKKLALIEKYRNESEPEYIRNRNAVRDIYLNEALNITLKLENAKNLRLTKEQFDELQAQLDAVVKERNLKQAEMREKWVNEINQKVETEISAEQARIRQEYETAFKASEDESARKINEVRERNRALVDNALKEIEYRQTRRQEILDELNYTAEDLDRLEQKIFDSIADEAGKLAAMNKLKLVVLRRDKKFTPKRISFAEPIKLNFKKPAGAAVYFGTDTVDLTKDLIKSMTLKGILTNS